MAFPVRMRVVSCWVYGAQTTARGAHTRPGPADHEGGRVAGADQVWHRAWKKGGRAGAVSASFDWLNLRLDLVAACSCAVHVVRTPGLSNVRKVQFPDFLSTIG